VVRVAELDADGIGELTADDDTEACGAAMLNPKDARAARDLMTTMSAFGMGVDTSRKLLLHVRPRALAYTYTFSTTIGSRTCSPIHDEAFRPSQRVHCNGVSCGRVRLEIRTLKYWPTSFGLQLPSLRGTRSGLLAKPRSQIF